MIRLSIAFFYKVGASLRPLQNLQPSKIDFDNLPVLFEAQNSLEGLFSTQWFWPAIRSSYGPGQNLLTAIKTITAKSIGDDLAWGELYALSTALNEFQTIINVE